MSNHEQIVLPGGARTPIGKFGGTFTDVAGYELGAAAAKTALERSAVDPSEIDEVVMGCIGQDAYNAPRVALAARLPSSVPADTVNRLWGSGLQAMERGHAEALGRSGLRPSWRNEFKRGCLSAISTPATATGSATGGWLTARFPS